MTKYKRYLAGIISAMMVISDLGSGGLMSVYAAEDESVVVDAGDAAGDEESAVVADETEDDSQQADGGEAVASDAEGADDEAAQSSDDTAAEAVRDDAADDSQSEFEATEDTEEMEVSAVEESADEADVNGDGEWAGFDYIEGEAGKVITGWHGGENVVIPSDATAINPEAFKEAGKTVKSVDFTKAVKLSKIYKNAFSSNSDLTGELDFSNCSALELIDEAAFKGTKITSLKFEKVNPDNPSEVIATTPLNTIGKDAFNGCTQLSGNVVLTSNLNNLGTQAFAGCTAIEKIVVKTGSKLRLASGTYFNTNTSKAELTSIEIIEGVDKVPDYLFKDIAFKPDTEEQEIDGKLQTVIVGGGIVYISSTVTEVGDYAFSGAKNLDEVRFADGSQLDKVGNSAFSSIKLTADNNGKITQWGLTKINLPISVTYVGNSAFSGNNVMPDVAPLMDATKSNLVFIGNSAFSGCARISMARIPDSVDNDSIGTYAFSNCLSLWDVSIPSTYTRLPDGVFQLCDITDYNDKFVNITDVGKEALEGNFYNDPLETLDLTKVVKMGESSFKTCGMVAVKLNSEANGLRYLPKSVFAGCPELTSINIPRNINDNNDDKKIGVGESAFSGCVKLATVTFADLDEGKELTIGTSAFSGCIYVSGGTSTGLKTVTFGKGLKEIGSKAFYECGLFSNTTFPDTLKTIGTQAFYLCNASLTSVTIPASVDTIKTKAFDSCDRLANVTIEGDINSCEASVFFKCGLKKIEFKEGVSQIPNSMFYAASYDNNEGATITIASSVEKIGDNAFAGETGSNPNLVGVYFAKASKLEEIGAGAFKNCTKLGEKGDGMDLPAGVATIGAGAFDQCVSLDHMFIPSTVVLDKDVTYFAGMKAAAFRTGEDTSAYKYLTEKGICTDTDLLVKGVKYITYDLSEYEALGAENDKGNSTCFDEHSDLTLKDAACPGKAFVGWFTDENCTVAYNPDTQSHDAGFTVYPKFSEQKAIHEMFEWDYDPAIPGAVDKTMIMGMSDEWLASADGQDWNGKWMIITKDCTSIAKNAFSKYERKAELNSVAFESGSSMISIGQGAFSGCGSITRLDFSNASKLKSIGNSAFSGCSGIKTIIFDDALVSIGDSAFEGCRNITELTLTKNLTSMGEKAFNGCSNLASITICCSDLSIASSTVTVSDTMMVTGLKPLTFGGCKISEIKMGTNAAGRTNDIIPAGIFYQGGFAENFDLVVDKNVKTIGLGAFAAAKGLRSVDLSQLTASDEQAPVIDNFAFLATTIESVTFCEDLKSIGEEAFAGCALLTTVTIPKKVETIKKGAFYLCVGLEDVDILSDKLTEIPEEAFMYDVNLSTVKFAIVNPDADEKEQFTSIKTIGKNAFKNCPSIKAFPFIAPLETIGAGAFENCTGLTSVALPATVKEIKGEIDAKDKKTTIGAFKGCTEIVNFRLNEGLTLIGIGAFENCTGIDTMTVPATVITIDESAYKGATALTEIRIDTTKAASALVTIGKSAFENDNSLTAIYNLKENLGQEPEKETDLPALETIGESAFSECRHLAAFDISKSYKMTSIGKKAFYNCGSLTSMNLSGLTVLETIGDNAFEGSRIESAYIPVGVTTLGAGAFKNCVNLRNIYYDAVNANKGSGNSSNPFFEGCEYISKLEFGNSVEVVPSFLLYKAELLSDMVVKIPDSVTTIGESSISGYQLKNGQDAKDIYSTITAIEFGPNSQLKSIGKNAFAYTDITEFTMPDTVTTVGEGALSNNKKLKSVVLSRKLDTIPNTLFMNDAALKTVDLNGAIIKGVGSSAFSSTGLESFSVPASATTIGTTAFAYCPNLITIFIPDSVTKLMDTTTTPVLSVFEDHSDALTIVTVQGSEADKYGEKYNIPRSYEGVHKIEYELNGGTNQVNAPKMFFEGAPTGLPEPTFAGHMFSGWYLDEALTQPITTTEGQKTDIKVYAKWDVDWSGIKYTINFDPGNSKAEKIEPIEVEGDAEVILPSPELGGYTFVGWFRDRAKAAEDGATPDFKGGQKVSRLVDKSGTITLYGKFVGEEFNITYMIADSSASNDPDNPKTYNVSEKDQAIIKAAIPSNKNVKFEGWYAYRTDIQQYAKMDKIPANCYGDLVLYAFFSYDKNSYNVKFDLDGGKMNGSLPSNIKASKKQHFYIPVYNAAVKDGYTFKGWGKSKKKATYSYETEYFREIKSSIAAKADDEDTSSSSDVTLYAVWGAYEFNVDGSMYGKSLDSVSSDGLWYFPQDEEKATEGGGFYTAKQLKTIRKSKMTHSADKKLKLLKPKKPGYTFSMWSIRNAEDGKEITTDKSGIPKGSECAKDIYVVPIWTENVFFITFDGNGGMVDGSKKLKDLTEYKYTTSVNMVSANRVTTIPGKTDGRKLAGWSFNKKDTTPMFKPGQVVNKVTLYDPKKDKASGYGKMSFKKKAKIKIYAI